MAEPIVNVKITTTADTGGAVRVTAAVKEATAATNPWVTASKSAAAAQKQLNEELKDALPKVNQSAEALDRGSKKGMNFGSAMLQGSRGVQDFAAAGIPGMVNNVESLASALGFGASAAGGFTLAFVGIELLMKSWPAIKAALGSPEENQKLWTSLSPDEEVTERVRVFTELLERQAEAYKNSAEARKLNAELAKEEDARNQRMAEVWEKALPGAFKDEAALPALPGTEGPSKAMQGKQAAQSAAGADYKAAEARLLEIDAAERAQKKLINDTLRFALLNESNRVDAAKQAELIAADSEGGSGAATAKEVDALQKQIQERAEQMKQMRTAGSYEALTGDPAKDEEALKRALDYEREKLRLIEAQRRAATAEVIDKQGALTGADAAVQGQGKEDKNQRDASAFGELGIKAPLGVSEGSDLAAGIPAALAGNMQAIQQAQQQAVNAVQQQGGAVTQSLNQLQSGVTATFSIIVSTLASINAAMKSFESQVETMRDTNRQ
jgi:hypothetical protein